MSWGDLLMPLIENSSNLFGTGDRVKERERKDALHDYQQQERIGIQARVEGAKAAGLHPLAALGFQSGPGPSIPVGGTSTRGISTESRHSPSNDTLNNAQIRLLHAQADEAEANARRAQYALATQPGNGPPDMSQSAVLPTERENLAPTGKPLRGVKVIPNEIEASAKGLTIGTHPGGTDLRIPNGPVIRMPSKAFADRADDLDLLKYWAIATMNKDRLAQWGADDLSPWTDINWKANVSRQKVAEKRENDRETIRFMNRSRAADRQR